MAVAVARRAVYHSRFNRGMAILAWLIAGWITVSFITLHEFSAVTASVVALVAFGAWALLWHPGLEVDDVAVTAHNVLRTVVVPWAALIDVDTKYSLTLRTPTRTIGVWAAPAPAWTTVTARSTRTVHSRDVRALSSRGRSGDAVGDSADAAALVRGQWERLREDGAIESGLAHTTPVGVRWHWVTDAVLAALVATVVVSLLLV